MSDRRARRTPRRAVSLARMAVLRSSRSLVRMGEEGALVEERRMRHWGQIHGWVDGRGDGRDEDAKRRGNGRRGGMVG